MESQPVVLRKSLLAGARKARGIAVIIDVLRAFSSAAFMFHLGAEQIVLAAQADEVLRLRADKGYLAVGEVGGVPVPGFDLGNSPSRILAAGRACFAGRTVALRTSAGVQGAVAAAPRSDQILLGSYVTARATARTIRALTPAPPLVSLVAMGDGARKATPDDERCADYFEHLLTGKDYDHLAALEEIVEHACTQKFLTGEQDHYPPADPLYCLQRDLFDFAIAATVEVGHLVARRVDAGGDGNR